MPHISAKVCICCLSVCTLPCCCIFHFIGFIFAQSSTLTPLVGRNIGINIPIGMIKLSPVGVNPCIWHSSYVYLPFLPKVKAKVLQNLYFTWSKDNILHCHCVLFAPASFSNSHSHFPSLTWPYPLLILCFSFNTPNMVHPQSLCTYYFVYLA